MLQEIFFSIMTSKLYLKIVNYLFFTCKSASFPFPTILKSTSSGLMVTISYSFDVAADDTDSLLRPTTSPLLVLPSVVDILISFSDKFDRIHILLLTMQFYDTILKSQKRRKAVL